MSYILREKTVLVKDSVITCDAIFSSEGKLLACLNEDTAVTGGLPGWTGVRIGIERVGEANPGRYFHFCPSHSKEVNQRLSRILLPLAP